MTVIDRNVAFDFGFAVAKRSRALRAQDAAAQQAEEEIILASVQQVMDQQQVDIDEALVLLHQRYDNVCARSEHHPLIQLDGAWAYSAHCTSCGQSTGTSLQPLEVAHRCAACAA